MEIGASCDLSRTHPDRGGYFPRIRCTDFNPGRAEIGEIDDVRALLAGSRPDWADVRWIDVAGGDLREIIHLFAAQYELHPLAVEDLVDGTHRAKVEDYPGPEDDPCRLFIIARQVRLEEGILADDQISLFLGRGLLLSFQQRHQPAFESIYRRVRVPGTRIRENDASFLCYSLLDAIVDSYFPVLDHYAGRIEEAEEELLNGPSRLTLEKAHDIKRGLLLLRRAIWPMREMIAQLQRERQTCLSETTLTYVRDVYDHCVQILDLNETYHEIAATLTETYVSVNANRLNEILKVLTVISTIFMPLTFIAGIYGMNMPIPENGLPYMYPIFWGICLAIVAGMLVWFRRHGWI